MKQLYINDIDANDFNKRVDSSSKFIEVSGKQIHYKDEGEGETIILLHGIAGSLFIWEKWAKHLKNHYRVIRPDLPAFDALKSDGFSLNYYTEFVEAFADKLGIARFFLGGHATGGQIAYETAAKIADRIRALVLIAPTGFSKINSSVLSATFRLAFKTFGKEHITWLTSRFLLKKHLKQLYHNSDMVTEQLTDNFLNDLLREGNRNSFFEYLQTENGVGNTTINEIVNPTLLLWGENDKIIPANDASKFKSLITSIRLITYPDSGHFPFDEEARKSCMDLVSFLEDFKNR